MASIQMRKIKPARGGSLCANYNVRPASIALRRT
jgi:hypothetical protein